MAEPPNRSLLIIGLDISKNWRSPKWQFTIVKGKMIINHTILKWLPDVSPIECSSCIHVTSIGHDMARLAIYLRTVIGYLEPILCMVSTPAPSEFHSARACGINLTAILILSSCFHSISACVFCVWVKVKGFCCEHHSAQSHRNSMWCWSHHIFSLTFEPKGRWSKFVLKNTSETFEFETSLSSGARIC